MVASPNGSGVEWDGAAEKARLVAWLETARRETLAALRGVDDFAVVHAETGWQVKDLLGHIAAWEREVLASLQAFHEGDEYSLGEDFDEARYNQTTFEKRHGLDPAQIRMDWAMVRRDLQFAVRDLDPARVSPTVTLLCPWHLHSTVSALVKDMVQHEAEHVAEILAAARAV